MGCDQSRVSSAALEQKFTNVSASGCPFMTLGNSLQYHNPSNVPNDAVHAKLNPRTNMEALKSEIRAALIDNKAFACPIAMRVAWHSSGTFDKDAAANGRSVGGSDGATMRFNPEHDDDANAGLHIVHDMLQQVKKSHPEVSLADLWTLAGCLAVEFMGGPVVPWKPGRTDRDPTAEVPDVSGAAKVSSDAAAQEGGAKPSHAVPENGRLPDAAQGAQHLRDVFYRMGFTDQEIVALSGGHTVGRCHIMRSGFDGPWTQSSLKFDNTYFKNLVHLEWKEKTVSETGNKQYENVDGVDKYLGPSLDEGLKQRGGPGRLMMLPTDIALKTDESFKKWVVKYATDEKAFFADFAKAYGKLMCLGCPKECDPFDKAPASAAGSLDEKLGAIAAEMRERAMHGSVEFVAKLCDEMATMPGGAGEKGIQSKDASSGRNALHKAAFWNHVEVTEYLAGVGVSNEKSSFKGNKLEGASVLDCCVQDSRGDTPLHDACRFGHVPVTKVLLSTEAGKKASGLKNADGLTPLELAKQMGKVDCEALF